MNYDIEKILPHNRPMILIDDIVEVNKESRYVIAKVTIKEEMIFFDKTINGISALTGIEFLAQTIGCYAFFGIENEKPKIGFLLGSRSYKNNLEKFENGETYYIKASEIFSDNELVSFNCLIYNGDNEYASAVINAFQPKNARKFLEG